MGLHTAFTALAEVIDAYESRGRSIKTVEASPAGTGDAVLDVTVAMPVSLRSGGGADTGLTPETARLTDTGDLEVTFSPPATDLPSTSGISLSICDASATVTDDGLLLRVDLTIDATAASDGVASADCGPEQAGSSDIATVTGSRSADTAEGDSPPSDGSAVSTAESVSDGDSGSKEGPQPDDASTADTPSGRDTDSESDPYAAVRDDSVPPYEDTDYLQTLYDDCDNFREIAEKIQMDVSSETVRRYMIEADIHVPNTYNTSDDGEEEPSTESAASNEGADQSGAIDGDEQVTTVEPVSAESAGSAEESVGELPDEQLVTDGIGLPPAVQLQDVADAVVESDTVYEVQRCLGLDRSQARDLLEELNLLDLVLRRLADESDQAVSYRTVASRIRQCTPHSA
ncbi:hypothetical protein SAMN05443574_1208 [Haloarcula vallismortis]|uniref:Uncharacterized protein n=2 Tax=Haloarcula vallismortis TaxID=28442 RepID=M0JI50_HALVA|nr:hypothetical protein [Haloarcula vallismortis]EMA08807.1 hypothetical protein C437_07617 [Haloarcula vallismortis ATCC 29715]SDX22624.1 hypothetical protein SAMN05443574_1208 [Haloarcula vallismortis]